MSLNRTATLLALSLAAASAARAQSPQTDTQALQQRIAALEEKIRSLEEHTSRSNADNAAQIDRLLRDAEQRSASLLSRPDVSAGYDTTFFIQSPDASFSIRPGLLFQFRNITDLRDHARPDGDSSTENGFEVRRMRFVLGGTAFTPNLIYLIYWDTNRNGGDLLLMDAWAHYTLGAGFGLRAGQFLDPLSHETSIGAPRQLAVDDSAANELLGGGLTDRVQGVSLTYGQYSASPLNAELTWHDGAASRNTDFRDTSIDPATLNDTRPDWGVAGRLEYKFFGDWKSYRDFTTIGAPGDVLVLSAGFDLTASSNRTTSLVSADAQWKTGPLSLYSALYMRHRDQRNIDLSDTTDWGALAQAAWALTSHLELFGRYDCVLFDQDFVPGQSTLHELTLGLNYYLTTLLPQRAKITLDINYLPNGAPPLTGIGYIGATSSAEWALRAQFQLAL